MSAWLDVVIGAAGCFVLGHALLYRRRNRSRGAPRTHLPPAICLAGPKPRLDINPALRRRNR